MTNKLYGIVAEFDNSHSLVDAAKASREAGYKQVHAYSPYHIEGLAEVLDDDRVNVLRFIVPLALIFGAFLGFLLQYWTSTSVYEFNIGGRPVVSIPAFLPVAFEIMILTAGITTFLAMFISNGLPLPYHPIFNAQNISTASSSGFFLCIDVTDDKFDADETKSFLEAMQPLNVSEVES